MNIKRNITLIGMAGVGKSTIAKYLAEKLGYEYVEVDNLITELTQKDGKNKEIIPDDEFMAFEEMAILSLKDKTNSVIDTGGSVIYSVKAIEVLKNISFIVYLSDVLENIKKRFNQRGGMHLIGMTSDKTFEQLSKERIPLYKKSANYTVEISLYRDAGKLVENIIQEYRQKTK